MNLGLRRQDIMDSRVQDLMVRMQGSGVQGLGF